MAGAEEAAGCDAICGAGFGACAPGAARLAAAGANLRERGARVEVSNPSRPPTGSAAAAAAGTVGSLPVAPVAPAAAEGCVAACAAG